MTALRDVVQKYDVEGEPAVAVGIYRDGTLVDHVVVGLASLEHGAPASTSSLFDIASSSKQFTSTCLLLLEKDGKLSLDDDLRDHLPGMRLRQRVTLRQCAQHTAGLREYMAANDLVGAGEWSWKTEEQVIRQLTANVDTDFEPGSQWSYSNTGYIALAAVVRAVSGSSFAEFASDRLLRPLGMDASGFADDLTAIVRGRAMGYVKADDGFRRADSPDEVVGDGGLVTSLVDLAAWQGFLHDGRVLGADVRDRLLTRAVLADGREIPYALGIEHETVLGRHAVQHGGAIQGYRAHLLHLLDEDLGVAVLANRSDVAAATVARAALAAVLGELQPVRTSVAAGPSGDPNGLWYTAREEMFVATSEADGRLTLEMGGASIAFVPAEPGAWRPETLGADVTLRITEDRLHFDLGEEHWNATHYDRVQVDEALDATSLVGTYLSRELGALARLASTDGGALTLHIGAAPPLPLTPVAPDLLRTPSHTVHVEPGADGEVAALLVSGGRIRRIRFERGADGIDAVGFPISMGGPLPTDPPDA